MYRSVAEVFTAALMLMAGGQLKQSTPADAWKGVGENFKQVGRDMRWAIDKVEHGRK